MYADKTQDPLRSYPQSSRFGCRTAETLVSQETLAAAAEAARHLQLVLGGDGLPFQVVLAQVQGAYDARFVSRPLHLHHFLWDADTGTSIIKRLQMWCNGSAGQSVRVAFEYLIILPVSWSDPLQGFPACCKCGEDAATYLRVDWQQIHAARSLWSLPPRRLLPGFSHTEEGYAQGGGGGIAG